MDQNFILLFFSYNFRKKYYSCDNIHITQFLTNTPCSSTVYQRQGLLAARMDLPQLEAGCPCILERPGEHPESAASLARWGTC